MQTLSVLPPSLPTEFSLTQTLSDLDIVQELLGNMDIV